jgi:hypothetical protein
MGVRHVVVFRWAPGTTEDQIAAVEAALAELPAQIPELRDYRFGRDLGLSDNTWDFAVVADCDDVEGFHAYRDHPAHRAAADELIVPNLADRAAVQMET